METNRDSPIEEPEAMKVRIIRKEIADEVWLRRDRRVKREIIRSSKLRSIRRIFFRHQQVLKILIMIMDFRRKMKDFPF